MNADERGLIYADLTEKILACAFKVHNTLGCGFLEKVYENALKIELELAGLTVQQQFRIAVYYRDQVVGEYVGDLLVNEKVIVELKVAKAIDSVHEAITLNYLNATRHRVCLILNFAKPRLEFRRLVHDTAQKNP